MRRSAVLSLLAATLTAALLFVAAWPAAAVGLDDFEQKVAEYHNDPVGRASQLSALIEKMQKMEVGLARQNDITVTQVLKLEADYTSLINLYFSIYYLQKHGTNQAGYEIDDDQVRAISSKAPPYSYLFYLDALQLTDACLNSVNYQSGIHDRASQMTLKLATEENELEKQYRLCDDKDSYIEADALSRSWDMQVIMAKLELCLARKAFYSISKALAEADLASARESYNTMFAMLGKIRTQVDFSDADFVYLDAEISVHTERVLATIKMLDDKYSSLSAQQKNVNNSEFVKFWLRSEQRLVEDELLYLEDMMEAWYSLRAKWRMMRDLLNGDLDAEEQKQLLAYLEHDIDNLDSDLRGFSDELQYLRLAEQTAVKRFGSGGDPLSPVKLSYDDQNRLASFLNNLEKRKLRYLEYTTDCGTIKSRCQELRREVRVIMSKTGSDKGQVVASFWRQKVRSLVNFEIWHFGDFPVTLGKLLYALATFLFIMAAALGTSYFVKRKAVKKNINRHSTLLMEKIIDYTGFVAAVLCALWSIRIPLTAFAFLGGAVAIAVGFGTQKIIGDIFSGIIMLFQKKLRVGDQVIIGDKRGIVTEITLQNTVLLCEESKHLIIPNSKVQDSAIVNLTLSDPTIRVELDVCIDYGSDAAKAADLMRSILNADKDVLKSPAYRILMEDFEDSDVKLTALFFVNLRLCPDERFVKSRLREKVLAAFTAAGISIPFPQSDVHIKNN